MTSANFNIRYATAEDAGSILEIYKPYILNTAITFEYFVPSLEDYEPRIKAILANYPFFVCEVNNKVVGYANAHRFRDRAAYDWDVETSVYVNEEFQKQGIASSLYNKVLDECKARGYHNAFAGITIPNDKSVNFHAKMGFTHIGVFKKCRLQAGGMA